MRFTRLRYFVVTAEEESVARAARRLRIAQPALTRQLRALEQDVGTPLLERHARGVRLLPAGEKFLLYARRALAEADAGVEAARRTASAAPGARLRVASPDWPHRARWVASALERLRRDHPALTIDYDTTPWLQQPEAVHSGRVDIGFGVAMSGEEYGADIVATRICDEPASSAVLPASHPLATRPSVTLADLRDLPTIVPPPELAPLLHEQMVATIRRGGYEPRVVPAPINFSAAAQMVIAGAGWILCVNSIALMPPIGTVVLPVADAPAMLSFFGLTARDDDRPMVHAFVRHLQEVAAAGEPASTAPGSPPSRPRQNTRV